MYTQQHFSNKNKNNKNASKTILWKPSMKDHPNDRPPLIKTHLKIFCIQISMCKTTFKTTIFPLNCSCIRPRFWKPFYPFKATFLGGCSTVLDSCFQATFYKSDNCTSLKPLYWANSRFGHLYHRYHWSPKKSPPAPEETWKHQQAHTHSIPKS